VEVDGNADDWSGIVKIDMLTCKVALTEYFAQYLELERKHNLPARAEQRQTRLELMALPGDEWWEWFMGDNRLGGFGGIALVRNGDIVWASNDWVS
jgi:hypothetical protein